MPRSNLSMTGALVVAILATTSALALIIWWAEPGAQPARGQPAPAVAAPSDGAAHPPSPRAIRRQTAAEPAAAPTATAAWTFEEFVDGLVAHAIELRQRVELRDEEGARDLDARSQALVRRLEHEIPTWDELSLAALLECEDTESDQVHTVRRRTLAFLLERGFEARRASGDRRRLDALVSMALAGVPARETTAYELGPMVARGERLGLAHEGEVLDLVALVPEQPWLAPIASMVLKALWRNLEATGARSHSELAALALLFKDDANPGRRIAAFEALVTLQGGRYRELVLHEIALRGDREAAAAVIHLAADALPVPLAIEVLQRLAPVARSELMAPCMNLAERDPEAVRATYEQLLASGTDAGLRADLISGLGFQQSSRSTATARLAFDQDPDPAVRTRALFALTAMAPTSHGIEVWELAAADPYFSDPKRAGRLIVALSNLATVADGSVRARIAGWAQDLSSRTDLLAGDRQRLEAIVAQAEPR